MPSPALGWQSEHTDWIPPLSSVEFQAHKQWCGQAAWRGSFLRLFAVGTLITSTVLQRNTKLRFRFLPETALPHFCDLGKLQSFQKVFKRCSLPHLFNEGKTSLFLRYFPLYGLKAQKGFSNKCIPACLKDTNIDINHFNTLAL